MQDRLPKLKYIDLNRLPLHKDAINPYSPILIVGIVLFSVSIILIGVAELSEVLLSIILILNYMSIGMISAGIIAYPLIRIQNDLRDMYNLFRAKEKNALLDVGKAVPKDDSKEPKSFTDKLKEKKLVE